MKQLVEIYIKLAEIDVKKEVCFIFSSCRSVGICNRFTFQIYRLTINLFTFNVQDMNKKLTLPRDIRSVRQLELVILVFT